jgi:hypothetical protein
MGIVHRATLVPSKQELVEAWLPTRPWAVGRSVARKVAEYRFDDPAGEVGVETILWATEDGEVLQTPLTYRADPLPGAETSLVGVTEHSVLGRRWVYDGCGDPIWATTLATVILTGGTQVQMFLEQDGQRIDIPPRMQVRGSGREGTPVPDISQLESVTDDGDVTVAAAGPVELRVARVVGTPLDGEHALRGTVGDSVESVVLATVQQG